MMSIPLIEWIRVTFTRSESARDSSVAPWQPAPHIITTLSATSMRLAICNGKLLDNDQVLKS
jgi:hypothetical protein